MGTTSTSGWALCWFLLGFTALGTSAAGGGMFGFFLGAAMITLSCALFKTARIKEES